MDTSTVPLPPLVRSEPLDFPVDFHGCSQRLSLSGGDFFAFDRDPNDDLIMMLGTLAPAGFNSELVGTGLQTTFKSLLKTEQDLAVIVQQLNHMLWDVSPGGLFSTLFCARVTASTRVLEYVNAGEVLAMLLLSGSGRGKLLKSSGAVLGLSRRSVYLQHRCPLNPGDSVVVLSEGLADAAVSPNRFFAEALPGLLASIAVGCAEDVATQLLGSVQASRLSGDRTIAVLRTQAPRHSPGLHRAAAA